MKRYLLLAVFMIMLTALISTFATLANPYNWSSVKGLLTALPTWETSLILLASIAFIWWVIRSTFAEVRKIDRKDKEDRKQELKEAISEALVEAGLAKRELKRGKRIKARPKKGSKGNGGS